MLSWWVLLVSYTFSLSLNFFDAFPFLHLSPDVCVCTWSIIHCLLFCLCSFMYWQTHLISGPLISSLIIGCDIIFFHSLILKPRQKNPISALCGLSVESKAAFFGKSPLFCLSEVIWKAVLRVRQWRRNRGREAGEAEGDGLHPGC